MRGRAFSRRPPAPRPTPRSGPSCARPGPTTRRCSPASPPTGPMCRAPATARCGILSVGLRPHEDGVVRPLRRAGAPPLGRRGAPRSRPDEADCPVPAAWARSTAPCTLPASARIDGRGMAAALRQAAEARGVRFVTGAAHGRRRRDVARPAAWTSVRSRGTATSVRRPGGGGWGLDGGRGGVAGPRPPGRPHQGADRASRRRGGDRRVAHRAASAHALPRALARVGGWPAAARSSRAPGSPSPSRRPACTSCCVSASLVAPGLVDASYLETRVGLRPTSADDRARGRAAPGLGQRLGGHRARGQRAVAGPLLGPGPGPHHGRGRLAGRRGAAARAPSIPPASAETAASRAPIPPRRHDDVRLWPC